MHITDQSHYQYIEQKQKKKGKSHKRKTIRLPLAVTCREKKGRSSWGRAGGCVLFLNSSSGNAGVHLVVFVGAVFC